MYVRKLNIYVNNKYSSTFEIIHSEVVLSLGISLIIPVLINHHMGIYLQIGTFCSDAENNFHDKHNN